MTTALTLSPVAKHINNQARQCMRAGTHIKALAVLLLGDLVLGLLIHDCLLVSYLLEWNRVQLSIVDSAR